MRISVSCISGSDNQVIRLDVPNSITVVDLKALIASEIPNISSTGQHLYHNGRLLSNDSRTLEELNMKDEDMVVVHLPQASLNINRQNQLAQRRQQRQQSGQEYTGGGGSRIEYDCELIRLQLLENPLKLEELREYNPQLIESIDDPDKFREAFYEMERKRAGAEREKQKEIQMLNEDPFNVDAQRRIEELIRQEAVMENLQSAIEHHPEVTFGRVLMLYVQVEVNGVAVKAFVDSGAQVTIMSPGCASRCGIMRFVDSRFSGLAHGVGTAKILGRVHSAQIKIGTLHLPCSFTVMEGKHVDLLLGLDMLKRHQAVLDLKNDRLIIQGEEVRFLAENEIPKGTFRPEVEPLLEGPSGTKIGGVTGAILDAPTIIEQGSGESMEGISTTDSHPEVGIKQLESLGFSRQQAISALDAANGNVDMAASLLFN